MNNNTKTIFHNRESDNITLSDIRDATSLLDEVIEQLQSAIDIYDIAYHPNDYDAYIGRHIKGDVISIIYVNPEQKNICVKLNDDESNNRDIILPLELLVYDFRSGNDYYIQQVEKIVKETNDNWDVKDKEYREKFDKKKNDIDYQYYLKLKQKFEKDDV